MGNEKTEKFFCTAGPVNQPDVYKIDPLTRWDLNEVLLLIQRGQYFLLHAPRQTGKTSCLEALATYLNAEGKYYAIPTSFECGANTGDDFEIAIKNIIEALLSDAKDTLKDSFDSAKAKAYFAEDGPSNGIYNMFNYLAKSLDKPLVLLIDEIDSLVGNTLINVLRQMRSGYRKRPDHFPHSVLLCGMRNIKDFRMKVGNEVLPATYSPFNIIAKSLHLDNFTKDDVENLYNQHTVGTGQRFEEGVVDMVMDYTDGQPWLVNAIAHEVTFEMRVNRDRSVCITKEMIAQAKENIILSRRTHLENLIERLKEDRVRRVILPMLTGEYGVTITDDINYCIDLGLIKRNNGGYYIANNIYKEVIPRELTQDTLELVPQDIPTLWKNEDGTINVTNLLTLFKDHWYESMDIWGSDMSGYKEAAAQLVTNTFLQRVINGGGEIGREYGIGRKRMDIYIKRPYYIGSGNNKTLKIQKIVLEVKTIKDDQSYDTVMQKAMTQTAEYAKLVGVSEAEILIFNRGEKPRWTAADPIEATECDGVRLQIWKL